MMEAERYQVAVCKYELQPRDLNLAPREGALVRLSRRGETLAGYGDIHPWPELGTPNLSDEIAALRCGLFSAALRSTISCALLDLKAQREGISLFAGLKIPPSHKLLRSVEELKDEAHSPSEKILKIKLGKDPESEGAVLLEYLKRRPDVKVRLDFNAKLSAPRFESFLRSMAPILSQIDFIEDPFPYDAGLWAMISDRYNVDLALDFAGDLRQISKDSGVSTVVIKPAICGPGVAFELAGRFRLIFTSMLDHPVGVAFAAWCAARFYSKVGVRGLPQCGFSSCGFSSQLAYQGDIFVSRLDAILSGSYQAAGFGFSDLLSVSPSDVTQSDGMNWDEIGEVVVTPLNHSGWEFEDL
jgi:O-succinylbenzoate synthase